MPSAIPKTAPAARARRPEDGNAALPLYAVWELTMKCDQPCQHCGSRAGHARPVELSTEEVLEVGRNLARMGCREVVLIGGEAYLREDIHEIVASLAGQGLRVGMQTGGRAMTRERAGALKASGLKAIGVSVDGTEESHDTLRGNRGSHAAALRALEAGSEVGLSLSANTQINRLNMGQLHEIAADLQARKVEAWQVQLTVPMGRAADRPDWIIAPYHILAIIEALADIQKRAVEAYAGGRVVNAGRDSAFAGPFNVVAGNNIGYFGPHEALLRSRPGGVEAHWTGCQAGVSVIGIESDGTVKACPSLPTAPYAGGNVRDVSLADLWERSDAIRFSRDRTEAELWGFCATCYYAENCRAGCSWTAHCTLGRRGNFPFCYHRVTELKKRGRRERLVLSEAAPQQPYDYGRFELIEEPWEDPPEGEAGRPQRRLPLLA